MSKNLVIVESPAKAKTIEKYLGKDFQVLSSIGHIRSIAKKTKDGTPPIDVQNGFATTYEIDSDKKKTITELKKAVKAADTVWLATDEDREGEAIAWHLCEVLKLDPKTTKRIVFHEITKTAIEEAVQHPRTVDMKLVEAQQARQILDRIVGFELSPVVWQKVPGGKSAGRVQSPAVRLIVERERDIRAFESSSQFKVTAELESEGNGTEISQFKAELPQRFDTEDEAKHFLEGLVGASYRISDVTKSPASRNPAAPFTTSTLQQDANAKLGFSSRSTMSAAQKLYQDGKITYMRTDSVTLSKQAMAAAASYIESRYGKEYVQVRAFKTKSASAQEAHEAIRPTDMSLEVASGNEYDQKLYNLIRNRTLASQMAPARLEKTEVTIDIRRWTLDDGKSQKDIAAPTVQSPTSNVHFVARGEVVIFPGFLAVYGGGKDDTLLPPLSTGDVVDLTSAEARQVFARPPARYTEGSLVKKLEELGIGRPSTYATIINTVQTRGYVERGESEGNEREVIVLAYQPAEREEERGKKEEGPQSSQSTPAATSIQSSEDSVIQSGEATWGQPNATGAKPRRELSEEDCVDAAEYISRTIVTEKTGSDRGKLVPTPAGELIADFLTNHFEPVVDYGFTASVEEHFDDIASAKLERNRMLGDFYGPFHALIDKSGDIDRASVGNAREIGIDPKTNLPIIARFGRFGPMLQLGTAEGDDKPQFAPLPKGVRLETVTLEQALEAFKLPRLVGQTDDGKDIRANIGRFGPYIQIDKLFVSIKPLDPHDITLEEAKELYAAKLKAEAEKNIADFGDGIKVLNGRFGPYITDGKKNAKIPKDTEPASITHDEAKKLLAAAPAAGKKRRFTRKKK
ncbi:MAG: type I DNA topoisomerase [Candidatus Saccharimonadales bacterium]|jgi:DNA topoisomerase-1